MPVPVLLLVERKNNHKKPEKLFWLISRILPLTAPPLTYIVTVLQRAA